MAHMIDWTLLAALVKPVRSGAWGRPSYPPLAMLKALFLQRWYSLSDEGVEEALSDRLSFRRFCGFAVDDETPDGKRVCRFRLPWSRLTCPSVCLPRWIVSSTRRACS